MGRPDKQDEERRLAARTVREQTVESFYDAMVKAGVTRAWVISEIGRAHV